MKKIIRALLVEDNPGDAELTKEMLEARHPDVEVSVVEDGAAALAYLERSPPYAAAPRPNLVLLDLNLPKMTGRQVLYEVKRREGLKTIPVVVLSSSEAERDVTECYALGAASYVSKPIGLQRFHETLNVIADYWFRLAHFAEPTFRGSVPPTGNP